MHYATGALSYGLLGTNISAERKAEQVLWQAACTQVKVSANGCFRTEGRSLYLDLFRVWLLPFRCRQGSALILIDACVFRQFVCTQLLTCM